MSVINPEKLEKLSVAERQALKEQIAASEEQLDNPEGLSASGQNGVAEMKSDVMKKKLVLERDESLRAQGTEKDRLAARLKEIEARILPDMPSMSEMWAKPGSIEADRAVRKNMAFHAKHGELVREWQNLKKRLEPDDPWAQNLDSIRPEK